ncbi:MAG: hypothetical protein U0414_16620 [Polyangiaceae bacterium]
MPSRVISSALLAASLALASSAVAERATAQTYSGSASRPLVQPKRAFVKGKVTKAESFELEKVRGKTVEGVDRFAIVVVDDVEQGDPIPLEEKGAEILPFPGGAALHCKKYFAMFSGASRDDVAALVGKTVQGVASLEPIEKPLDSESLARCVLVPPLDKIVPGAKRASFNLWTLSDTPGTLEQIERARGLFEPDRTAVHIGDQTPLDAAITYALQDMKSREALELALRMHMYSAIRKNSAWRDDPSSYPLLEKALLETPWPHDDPDPSLAALFWHASSGNALTKVDELASTRPALAAEILRDNLGWVSASALFEELVDAKKIDLGEPHDLRRLSTDDAFLERHREDNPSFTSSIDDALTASKERRDSGITDGWSLVRWIAKNKKTPRHGEGMRVTLVGSRASCCDLRALISDDVDLDVRVDCDAEQHRTYCGAKDAPSTRTVTGVVKALQYSKHRFKPGEAERPIVRVDLDRATVVDGGEIPAPASLDEVPAAATAAPISDAKPSSGCGCTTSAHPVEGIAGALALLALLGGARHARTSRGGRASPARGRAG